MSKNIALIIAGGSGSRMGLDIPKQFVNINGKPVIIYTLEAFEKHPQIDAIEVVCIDGWEDTLKSYADKYNINKLLWITKGGKTGQESIRNGIFNLDGNINDNDNIIIHDGVRPMLDSEIISDVIVKCNTYGNGVSSMPYNEQIFLKKDEISTDKYIPRETLRRVVTPQAYKFGKLKKAYKKAFEDNIGINGSSYTNTMMTELGETLYFAAGSDKNIKLTTPDNLQIFKAMVDIDALKEKDYSNNNNINDELYLEDINNTINAIKDIDKLRNKKIFITGSNGLIGSFIIDLIMYLNDNKDFNTTIIANARNKDKLEKKFNKYLDNPNFKYYIEDINNEIKYKGKVDYIINCASNTHPYQYSTDPIGTIMTNIKGTDNILKYASNNNIDKVLFLSSVEIYGENINNIERFKENEMGYINCNSLRAGYNESKRAGEALCQAYIENKGLDISIVRLPRIYGPTVKEDDTKAMSQFINKGINKEDIILKSEGNQYFSYLYVADAVSGLLRTLIAGKNGEAYNLGNIESDIRLKDLATTIANLSGTKVIFDLPDETEKKGYSKATIARLDYTKALEELDWIPQYSIEDGLERTLNILKDKKVKTK